MWTYSLTLVALALAWIGWWYWHATKGASSASHFELTPTGSASITTETAGPAGVVIRNTLLSQGGSLVVHRWHTRGVTRTALTLIGMENPAKTASQIAEHVGATITRLDEVPLPEVRCYASVARLRRTGRTALGENLGAFVDAVVDEFEAGEADAFYSVVIEPMRKSEVGRLRAYLSRQIGDGENASTHPQLANAELVKAHFVAGANDPTTAAALAVAPVAYLPGYDVEVRAQALSDAPVLTAAVAGVVAGVAAVVVGGVSIWTVLPMVLLGAAVAIACVASPAPVRQTVLERTLGAGVVPSPVTGPLRALGLVGSWGDVARLAGRALVGGAGLLHALAVVRNPDKRADALGRARGRGGSRNPVHPLPATVVPLAPAQTMGLLMVPSASQSINEMSTTKVPAPSALREVVGVHFGTDAAGHGIQVADADRGVGVFVLGDPGSGKTQELLHLWGGDLVARKYQPLGGTEPTRGGRTTMLWVETKGEGAQRALDQAGRAGYAPGELTRFSASSGTGPRLELFDPARPEASARTFVAALTSALPSSAIGSASKDALLKILTLALHTPAEVVAQAHAHGFLTVPNASVIDIAYVLAGGRTRNNAQDGLFALLKQAAYLAAPTTPATPVVAAAPAAPVADADDFEALMAGAAGTTPATEAAPAAAAAVPSSTPFQEAVEDYASDVITRTPAQRRELLKAPLNKLSDLRGVPNLWRHTEGRPTYTVADIVAGHGVNVVDFSVGGSLATDEDSVETETTGEDLAATVAAMFLYLLRSTVRSLGGKWAHEGRAVSFYCDELSDLAVKDSENADVVAWLFDKGRASGVQMNVATQRWQQLPYEVASAAKSAGTLIYLRLANAEVAAAALADVVVDDASPYTVSDLRNLANSEAICRTRIHGVPQRYPFTLLVPRETEFSPALYGVAGWEKDQTDEH